jgi:hypothetical protein
MGWYTMVKEMLRGWRKARRPRGKKTDDAVPLASFSKEWRCEAVHAHQGLAKPIRTGGRKEPGVSTQVNGENGVCQKLAAALTMEFVATGKNSLNL